MGTHYLMLTHAGKPALEMKWRRVKGRFSHTGQLRRLVRRNSSKRGVALTSAPLPAAWEASLSAFEAGGFVWKGPAGGGAGAVLYCPRCRNAALIQFHGDAAAAIAPRVLRSFRDHSDKEAVEWAVYDIHCFIPGRFVLQAYRFTAGEFVLTLQDRRHRLTLFRWAPAAVLMADGGLGSFVSRRLRLPEQTPNAEEIGGMQSLVWQLRTAGSRWRRWRRPKGTLFAWHRPDKNRILGLRITGKKPLDRESTAQLVRDFGIV